MNLFICFIFQILLISEGKTVAVNNNVGVPTFAVIDPVSITVEKNCEGGNCDGNDTTGEVQIASAEDDYYDGYYYYDLQYNFNISQELQAACIYETPEEQFRRVDTENKSEVDFEGYDKMVDNCGRAYRKIDFNRIDTNSKIFKYYF